MSARIVKFNCHGCHAPAYGCSLPGDNSGDYVLHSDYAALLARHNALREAVEWERECRVADVDWWLDVRESAVNELGDTLAEARAEVDRLLLGGS